MFKKLNVAIFCLTLISGLFVIGVSAQKSRTLRGLVVTSAAPEANFYDLDQCRNGAVEDATNPDCIDTGTGASGWVNGNAGSSNSHWAESQFIAYRLRFNGISTTGTHTLVLEYDIRHSSTYAIDYLGGYNVTETDAVPCSGVSGCAGAPNNFLIPADPQVTSKINPNTGLPIVVAPAAQRQMSIWGGTITNIVYNGPFTLDPTAGQQARSITVTFTASVSNPVIAWGGHIAWRGDWGAGNSAGGISGSPYHMRVIEFDGSGGNQDRSLSADAVDASGGIVITKRVETPDNTDMSAQVFSFTASAFFPNDSDPQNQFTLVDNFAGSQGASRGSAAIFGTQTVMVFETPAAGWTLSDVLCNDSDSVGDVLTASATIHVNGDAGEIVTCTFVNALQVPTAADASISGRVTDRYGRGISGAIVTAVDLSTGEVKYGYTSTFGNYMIDGLPVANLYNVSVRHSKYTFYDPVRTFSLDDNLTGVDFTATR